MFALEREARGASTEAQPRLNFYSFVWSILGVAAATFVFINADPVARSNWQYWTAAAAVGISFVTVGLRRVASPFAVVRSLRADIAHLASARAMLVAAVVATVLAVVALCGVASRGLVERELVRDVGTSSQDPKRGTHLG
jgi:hypothetical protein